MSDDIMRSLKVHYLCIIAEFLYPRPYVSCLTYLFADYLS